jgi:hypothetical protein
MGSNFWTRLKVSALRPVNRTSSVVSHANHDAATNYLRPGPGEAETEDGEQVRARRHRGEARKLEPLPRSLCQWCDRRFVNLDQHIERAHREELTECPQCALLCRRPAGNRYTCKECRARVTLNRLGAPTGALVACPFCSSDFYAEKCGVVHCRDCRRRVRLNQDLTVSRRFLKGLGDGSTSPVARHPVSDPADAADREAIRIAAEAKLLFEDIEAKRLQPTVLPLFRRLITKRVSDALLDEWTKVRDGFRRALKDAS